MAIDKIRFQMRQGTAAEATAANDVLIIGEWGYETDTGKLKIGDGATAWNSLPYFAASLPLGGSTGQVLTKASATDGDANWQTPSGGNYSLIASQTLAANGTTLEVTIPSGTKRFRLNLSFKNTSSTSTLTCYLYYNGDTTNSHYYSEILFVSGSTTTAAYTNDGTLTSASASQATFGIYNVVTDIDGYKRLNGSATRNNGSSIQKYESSHLWQYTPDVTKVTVVSGITNGFSAGSTLEVYSM